MAQFNILCFLRENGLNNFPIGQFYLCVSWREIWLVLCFSESSSLSSSETDSDTGVITNDEAREGKRFTNSYRRIDQV